MTPVEERIDHEEAKAKLASWQQTTDAPPDLPAHFYYEALYEATKLIDALLTEHSAREDLEQTLWDVLEWDDGDGHPHPPSMFRLAKRHIRERHRTLNGRPTSIHDRSLPATEPAQPEEER